MNLVKSWSKFVEQWLFIGFHTYRCPALKCIPSRHHHDNCLVILLGKLKYTFSVFQEKSDLALTNGDDDSKSLNRSLAERVGGTPTMLDKFLQRGKKKNGDSGDSETKPKKTRAKATASKSPSKTKSPTKAGKKVRGQHTTMSCNSLFSSCLCYLCRVRSATRGLLRRKSTPQTTATCPTSMSMFPSKSECLVEQVRPNFSINKI